MRRFSLSLSVKAVASGALLLLLSSAAIGFAVLGTTHAEMRRTFDSRIEFMLETTAQGLGSHLLPSVDLDEVDHAVAAPIRSDGVVFCACFGPDGKLVGFDGIPEFDEPLAPRLAQLGPAAASALHLTTRRGDPVRLRLAPVLVRAVADPEGRPVGTLLLGYTDAPLEAEFAPVRRQVGTIVITVGVAAALLAWLLAHSLVRPILELVAGTQRIAQGDFDHRVDVRSHDEIALLAQSFNAMTADLAESRDVVSKHQHALEVAVRERTSKLRDAYAELRVLDKMKDAFLSSISHELRTPITSIRAFAEILHQDDSTEPCTRQEFAGIILKESDHLSHLVGDVLDLVTIESGDVPFRFATVHPAEIARAAARQVEAAAREQGIAIEVAAAPDLPSVSWDGAKITRLVLELLDNAVRFTPRDGHATVTVSRAGDLVRFDVRDDGPGILACELESIFGRFQQGGEVLTGKPKGQGLGLAICRVIAQRHGGTVRAVASSRGAHLVVDLPLSPPPRPAAIGPARAAAPSAI